jgi:hypothetical protein
MLSSEMKRVIDTGELLGTVDLPECVCQVCASAAAQDYPDTGKLEIRLESFLRTTGVRFPEKQVPANWPPKADPVTESVGPEEMLELAREIFQRWVRKVRQATSALHSATF